MSATTPKPPDGPFEPARQDTIPFVDPCEWESYVPEHANHGGYTYLRVKRRKTVGEVHGLLKNLLGVDETGNYCIHPGVEEYFNVDVSIRHSRGMDREWPQGRIIVYSVTGSSEGDYVHVEVIDDRGERHPLILGKTFQGRDAAWAAARRIADLLGA